MDERTRKEREVEERMREFVEENLPVSYEEWCAMQKLERRQPQDGADSNG